MRDAYFVSVVPRCQNIAVQRDYLVAVLHQTQGQLFVLMDALRHNRIV